MAYVLVVFIAVNMYDHLGLKVSITFEGNKTIIQIDSVLVVTYTLSWQLHN